LAQRPDQEFVVLAVERVGDPEGTQPLPVARKHALYRGAARTGRPGMEDKPHVSLRILDELVPCETAVSAYRCTAHLPRMNRRRP
jgi:hypothetical protein